MEDIYRKQGMFSWNELMTTDVEAAKLFYNRLLGWEFQTLESPEMTYYIVKANGKEVGGIMALPEEAKGAPPMWGSCVTVDDVDKLVGETETLGGKVLVPPRDIPDVGRFAVIQDNQGAALTLITYLEKPGSAS